jgi:nicotinate-nucleotide pyrophosphorylase (carboxylating)
MKKINFLKLHQSHFNFKTFVQSARKEDKGDGDHTTLSTIPISKIGKMHLKVKESGILSGVEAAKIIFQFADKKIKFKQIIGDGIKVNSGDIAFVVTGNMRQLLTCERLILNVMQRMSGIATYTNYINGLCAGTGVKILDTRKTTPGFRFFEKWAVKTGGGENHRYGLFDMILIKDNHIDCAGGISKAIDAAHAYLKKKNKKLKIEVEARSLGDVSEILQNGKAHRILLDNFTPTEAQKAVQLVNKKLETECSGGINEQNIRSFAETGVDYISVGALTHQIKSMDLSLKFFQ